MKIYNRVLLKSYLLTKVIFCLAFENQKLQNIDFFSKTESCTTAIFNDFLLLEVLLLEKFTDFDFYKNSNRKNSNR